MGEKHLQEAVPDGSAAVRYQPYPEYTLTNDERLLQLPAHWNIAPLRYLLNEPLTNGLFKKREHWGSGLRIVNVFDVYIKGDVVQETSLERVSCDIPEQKKYSAEHGDFFFVRSSLKLEGIGKSASVLNPTEPMVFECHLVRGRPNTDTVCPKYLSYILNSSYCRQSLISLANQVTMTTIDQEKFKSLKISHPDLHEQQTIAAFLDYKTAKIDALIAKKKALLEKLAEKRTALISHAVTKGLDPKTPMRDSGIDWLGEIPAHWEVCLLKRLAEISYGVGGEIDRTLTDGIPLISLPNVSKDGVLNVIETPYCELSEGEESCLLKKGDLIFNWRNGSSDHLGKTVLFDLEGKWAHVSFLLKIRFNLEMSDPRYFFYMLNGLRITGFFKSSKAGVNNTFNMFELSNLFVIQPPLKEQKNIADELDEEMKIIQCQSEVIETAMQKLQEYRSALITNAVTGKIDLRSFRFPEDHITGEADA